MKFSKCSNPAVVLSLGAGVQSTTLALLAEAGDIPRPELAVFADTQSEPPWVYEQLEQLRQLVSFPIETVTQGNLEAYSLNPRKTKTGLPSPPRQLPVFYEAHGKTQLAQRRCTTAFKIHPIRRATHRYCSRGVIQQIGISTDEATRMRDSTANYIQNSYPLIDLNMSRSDCIQWLEKHGFQVPKKSSCIFCPFHDDRTWSDYKQNYPEQFARAVQFERELQAAETKHCYEPFTPYLHRSLKPLDQIQFEHQDQPNLFENDCSGSCGV